jgi:hypothetical protein
LTEADAAAICSAVTPNARGEYPFKELLELLFDNETAAQLYSASEAALRNDTWKTGRSGPSGATDFKAPREPRGPASGALGEVGQALIETGRNYEQALLDACGPDAQQSPAYIREE